MITPGKRPGLKRRNFLRLGLAGSAALALTACAPSPLIAADRTPTTAPTLDDARRQVAQATADLIALAEGSAALADADASFTAWCTALAAQHQAHLTVLCQADPLGGVLADATPIETVTPGQISAPASQAEAISALAEQETALAELLRDLSVPGAGEKTDPETAASTALLWESQWLCAEVAAAVLGGGDASGFGPAPVAGDAVPAQTEMGDLAAAQQVLLSRQRALVFGLQALYGRVDYQDPMADLLNDRLGEAMRERDETAALIVAGGATPAPQPPEYAMPGDVTDSSQTTQIWGELELAVLNAWARLGAVDSSGRAEARQQALLQAGRVRAQDVALTYWPGWV